MTWQSLASTQGYRLSRLTEWQVALIATGSGIAGTIIGGLLAFFLCRWRYRARHTFEDDPGPEDQQNMAQPNRSSCELPVFDQSQALLTQTARSPLPSALTVDSPVSMHNLPSDRRHRSLNSGQPQELFGTGISEQAFALTQTSRRPTDHSDEPTELPSRESSPLRSSLFSFVSSIFTTGATDTPLHGYHPQGRLRSYPKVEDLRAYMERDELSAWDIIVGDSNVAVC